jgi:hypothetical protein
MNLDQITPQEHYLTE